MLRGLEGWHIVIIVGIIVLLFGSRKLPDAARSMGQSLRIFKSEMKAAAKDDTPAAAQQSAAYAPPAVEGHSAPVMQDAVAAQPQPVAEQR